MFAFRARSSNLICRLSAFRGIFFAILISPALVLFDPAHAVQRSVNNQGQALIYPYFGVLGGNDTLITISSSEGAATNGTNSKALKVHFRDNLGNAILSFNLYLEPQGTWTAALRQQDGMTTLITNDDSCTVPALDSASLSSLSTVRSGWLEVIEMGEIDSSAPIHESIRAANCNDLETQWANGEWAGDPLVNLRRPSGEISGSASLINVEKGAQYSFPVVALERFSTIVQHTAPDSAVPDLSSVFDEGTEDGMTSATLCGKQGCRTKQWNDPVDAVAYALLGYGFSGSFSTERSINAESEVVFTYPLQRFYDQRRPENTIFAFKKLQLLTFDREGTLFGSRGNCTGLFGPLCNSEYSVFLEKYVQSFTFGRSASDFGETLTSPILGEPSEVFFPTQDEPEIPESGTAIFYTLEGGEDGLFDVNRDGAIGYPVIATMLTEVSNGTLVPENGENVRANYGTAKELDRIQVRY